MELSVTTLDLGFKFQRITYDYGRKLECSYRDLFHIYVHMYTHTRIHIHVYVYNPTPTHT